MTIINLILAIPQLIELVDNLIRWFGPDFNKAIREQNENYRALKAALEAKDEDAIHAAERAVVNRWNRLN